MKRYGKCERKVVWIVKWYGKYGRKVKAAAAAEASAPASSTTLYTCTFCIYIVFQNWEESSWKFFFLLEIMQVGIKKVI